MERFVGRTRELRQIAKELDKNSPSLIIAYGRRRIGKSRLLLEASSGRNVIYFQATRVSSVLNLEQFKREVGNVLGASPILDAISNWEAVLHYIVDATADRHGTVVIIDEFPYLVDGDSALPSIIQRFWDSRAAAKSNLKLILCGSAVAQMENLLAEKNPLYGRMTLRLEVRQLPLRDIVGFFPDYTAEQVIETYAVFGGVPHYLTLCASHLSLRENIINLLLTDTGALADEPMTLLQSELREPGMYASVIGAVSEGLHSLSEVAARLKTQTTTVAPYVEKLSRLHLLRSVRSLDAANKERNRRIVLTDNLMGFWYRFVRPNLTAISSGFGVEAYDNYIQKRFPEYMGGAFEGICLDYARYHLGEILSAPAREVGSIWGHADFDIDVGGRLLDDTFFYGECKWRSTKIDIAMVDLLKKRSEATSYGRGKLGKQYLLFSRNGWKSDVADTAKVDASVHLIGPDNFAFPPPEEPKNEMTASIKS